MIRFWLCFYFFIGCAATRAENESADFILLQSDMQLQETLPFYLRHAPVESPSAPGQAVKFEPLPEGITTHLTEVGYLRGHRIVAVRYLSDSKLVHGNTGAIGLAVLRADSQASKLIFSPVIVAWGEEIGTVDDFTVSPLRQLRGFFFFWVRRDYSGTGNFIDRIAVTATEANETLHAYPLFDKTDPLAELSKEGWELWHRGNFFDEDTLTWHFHLYRDPKKGKGGYPHAEAEVRYEFRDGKLRPGKVKLIEETE